MVRDIGFAKNVFPGERSTPGLNPGGNSPHQSYKFCCITVPLGIVDFRMTGEKYPASLEYLLY